MRFFELTHPTYTTDREEKRRNPVTSNATHHIPGISCEVCGRWSSSSRLRLPSHVVTDEFLGVSVLTVPEWTKARDGWGTRLGVDPALIEPGAELGPPRGTCTRTPTEDVVHPFPGEVWISDPVVDALKRAALRGVSFAEVQLTGKCGATALSEIVAHGRSWRENSTIESLRLCNLCLREGFPSPENLRVDAARWDRSD